MRKIVLILIVLVSSNTIFARIQYSINESWDFLKTSDSFTDLLTVEEALWERVYIPHTWNSQDTMDDEPGYYRGPAWYKKKIFLPSDYQNKQITILFEGANQEVDLYINGEWVGNHKGGYTKFSFNITQYVKFNSENDVFVKVTNEHNIHIPPLSADFTFFGGIYRDIYLIVTENQHISTTHYASEGVYISTPEVNEKKAKLNIKTMLSNASSKATNLKVEHILLSPDKKEYARISTKQKVDKNANNVESVQSFEVQNPELWSTEAPNLYMVVTRLYDSKGTELMDEVVQTIGLRWFEFSVDGFKLNGKPIKLVGTNRHQCYDGMGNALPDEIHIRDVLLLKEMGGNFLRVSHYPQDPVVMEMCDKLGIITSVEIPIVNAITEEEGFYHNSLHMAREMVLQDYNRPSVLIWAYMNEVLLRLPFNSSSPRYSGYLANVRDLAEKIENQIRSDDPFRYTLIPFHGNFNLYHKAGLSQIPMIIGWNLYQGWYSRLFKDFDKFLDNAHKDLPETPFIITEYGADVDPRLHSFTPKRFDYTQEWANLYHEHYYKAIMERPFVVGSNIWNLNDFHSEERGNAVPHINNKGIVSTDRQVKDTYLQYQALLHKEDTPIINIGGRNWTIRGGVADGNYASVQKVKVYSNLDEVEMFVDGVSIGTKETKGVIAEFDVPFKNGKNTLEAVGIHDGTIYRDLLKIDFRMIASNLKDELLPFETINVMLGSARYFEEKDKSILWIPEKPYTPGSWGYVGGEPYVKKTRHGEQPASDLNILYTNIDPVYQTMRTDIESFKFDVPKGVYTLSLYFAELVTKTTKILAYNLGDDALDEEVNERIFDVSVNGATIIHGLNLSKDYGELVPVEKKFTVHVLDENGITIDFSAIADKPILNAVRLYRKY